MNRIKHWAKSGNKKCYKLGFRNNGSMICSMLFVIISFMFLLLTMELISLAIFLKITIILVIIIAFFVFLLFY